MLSHGKINDRKELYSNYVLIITVSMYCLTLIYIVVQVPNVVDLRRGVYNYILHIPVRMSFKLGNILITF